MSQESTLSQYGVSCLRQNMAKILREIRAYVYKLCMIK